MKKAWKLIPKRIDKNKEEELRREPLEKGDRLAMFLAAMLTLFLPAVIVLLLVVGICYLLFFH